VDALKIDRFFIQNIVDDSHDAAIVTAIIALARSLGIQVVAEGVETQQQLDYLRNLRWDATTSLRCERVQGFLLQRPMPAEQARDLLLAGSRR
jgi:EAL domain-containing protein (putative c-di-GMP-specific phosphodiesterase class I)